MRATASRRQRRGAVQRAGVTRGARAGCAGAEGARRGGRGALRGLHATHGRANMRGGGTCVAGRRAAPARAAARARPPARRRATATSRRTPAALRTHRASTLSPYHPVRSGLRCAAKSIAFLYRTFVLSAFNAKVVYGMRSYHCFLRIQHLHNPTRRMSLPMHLVKMLNYFRHINFI